MELIEAELSPRLVVNLAQPKVEIRHVLLTA